MMFFHVEHDSARERRSGSSRDSRRCSRMSNGRRRSKAHMVVECVRAGREQAEAHSGLSSPGRAHLYRTRTERVAHTRTTSTNMISEIKTTLLAAPPSRHCWVRTGWLSGFGRHTKTNKGEGGDASLTRPTAEPSPSHVVLRAVLF